MPRANIISEFNETFGFGVGHDVGLCAIAAYYDATGNPRKAAEVRYEANKPQDEDISKTATK